MLATQGSTRVCYNIDQNTQPEKPSRSFKLQEMTKEEKKEINARVQEINTLRAEANRLHASSERHMKNSNEALGRANSAQERAISAQKGIDECENTIKQAKERNAKRKAMLAMLNNTNPQPQTT